MKKAIFIGGLLVAALAMLGAGAAFAQGPGPIGGNGPMMQAGGGYLHTYMVTAFAGKLGLSVEDINARLAAGETMYNIAIAEGIQAEDFAALMIEVRASALSAAVKDGVITQEQADWMSSHGFGRGGMMNGTGYGTGNCPMHNGTGAGYGPGMMGGGFGWQNPQTNP